MIESVVVLEVRTDNLPSNVARKIIWPPALTTPRNEEPIIVQTNLK
jgi:hypothetical protein